MNKLHADKLHDGEVLLTNRGRPYMSKHAHPLCDQEEDLVGMVSMIYKKFEEEPKVVLGILHTELYQYVLDETMRGRWEQIKKLLKTRYSNCSLEQCEMASATIRYYLSASTWFYFRYNFKFSIEKAIAIAEQVITQTLRGLEE